MDYWALKNLRVKRNIEVTKTVTYGILFKVFDGIYRIRLVKTEHENLPYVPYNCIGLVQKGKNFVQTGNLKLTDGASGITITKLAENKYLLNGETVNQGRIMADTFDKIPNKPMTVTFKRLSGTATGGLQGIVYI